VLEIGRYLLSFQMMSLEFYIDIIVRPHCGLPLDSVSDRNEYQK